MPSPGSSNSRGLIRSMLVIGSAQVVNIGLSILRMKVVAMLLGPSGVGLLSIYTNLQGMVSNAAGLGMSSSGVREIASARGEEQALSRVRRVLLAAHLIQGLLAMLGVWLLREQISIWLLGDASYALEIALVGIAILLTLMMSAQTALLQGLQRIGDLGRVTVLGALGATLVGLAVVWSYGQAGLVWFVLTQPLMGLLAALYFTRRLPKPSSKRPNLAETWAVWKPMARLGAAFMLGGLASTATLLIVRGRITQELGLDAAGQFAASWSITITYVGFLLGAMGADYFPRLTKVIHDRVAAIRLMNDQAQLGLALGGPVLLVLIAWAPWVINILYSSEFAPAATLLQWQSVGNVLKVASWALSFAIVAGARAKTFFFMELSFNIVFLAIVWLLLPSYGLTVAGVAFLLGYVAYFATVNVLVRRIHAFRWQKLSLSLLVLHVSLAFALLFLAQVAPIVAIVIAPILALMTGLLGLHVVITKIGTTGRFAASIARVFAALGWPIRSDA